MDYGKLAYLKAVDLEGRLIVRSQNFVVSVEELSDIAKDAVIASISGEGDIAIFIESSDFAEYFVDEVKVCEGTNVFFKLAGGGVITAKSEHGVRKLRIMVLGNIAESESVGRGYADYNGDRIAYLTLIGGRAKTFVFDITNFEPSQMLDRECLSGDICAYNDGFMTAIVNSFGDIVIIADGEKAYNVGASRVAVSAQNGITVAFIRGGKAYWFTLPSFGAPLPTVTEVRFGGVIDDIRFVRHSQKLLFSSGGKCFVTDIAGSADYDDKLYIDLGATLL